MDAKTAVDHQWPYLLTFFPPAAQLDTTATELGAIRRKRAVDGAEALLRLSMVYGGWGFSLRQTAAWAEAAGVASLSDVALLKRLRKASDWLGHLLAIKLAERAALPQIQAPLLRLVDATAISRPASTGTDWRVHLGFDLRSLSIHAVELTDHAGAESLTRFHIGPGEIVLGDRGYAHRKGLYSVRQSGGDFIVRINWQNVPLQFLNGQSLDILAALRTLPEAGEGSFAVQTAPDPKNRLPAVPVRLVGVRKSETAAEESRRKILRDRAQKGQTVDPRTLEAAAYIFVLTSVPEVSLSAKQVLDLYRFRWQIEMAFKRMKGRLELGVLPAKDASLARTIIYSKLLAALVLDDFTSRFLAISPWGFPLQ
jgi:hypothetical protein